MSRFAEVSEGILAAIRAGSSLEDASFAAGVPSGTVRRWLTAGRKGQAPYADWAAQVDEHRLQRRVDVDQPLTHAEVERILTVAARRGSLQAVRIWLRLHPLSTAGPDDPLAAFLPGGLEDA